MMARARAFTAARIGAAAPRHDASRQGWGLRIAMLAVALHFLVSSSLLHVMGIPYNVPGGNPLAKFHPSTYLLVWAMWLTIKDQGGIAGANCMMVRHAPSYLFFFLGMLLCTLFSGLSTGTTGAAVFLESYLTAGLLAYVLETAPEHICLLLGRAMLVLCLLNVAVATGENITHVHVVPPYIAGVLYVEAATDFRGTAGFDHPLTGAAVVMMMLFTLPTLRLSAPLRMLCALLLFIGLLVFGGRTALAVSIFVFLAAAVAGVVKGLARRSLSPALMLQIAVVVLVLPALTYILLTQTPIGERLVAHFYIDDSADTRSVQWEVLKHMSLSEYLFGMKETHVPDLVFTLNLDTAFSDIENPWLLNFMKLGIVGSVLFLAGLVPFLLRQWRTSGAWGRAVLVFGLLVISSSNTIGHKSNLLVLLVAFIGVSRMELRRADSTAPQPTPSIPTRSLSTLAWPHPARRLVHMRTP